MSIPNTPLLALKETDMKKIQMRKITDLLMINNKKTFIIENNIVLSVSYRLLTRDEQQTCMHASTSFTPVKIPLTRDSAGTTKSRSIL